MEKRIDAAAKEGFKFERVVVSRDEALSMFAENKFKVCVCDCVCVSKRGCAHMWACTCSIFCV